LDNEFPEGSRISSERFEDQLYEILKSPNSIIIGVGIDVDDKDENGAIKVNPISMVGLDTVNPEVLFNLLKETLLKTYNEVMGGMPDDEY
jgi:hypothetical protein